MAILVDYKLARHIFIQWLANKNLLVEWLDRTNKQSCITIVRYGEKPEDPMYDADLATSNPTEMIFNSFGFALQGAITPTTNKWLAIDKEWRYFIEEYIKITDLGTS